MDGGQNIFCMTWTRGGREVNQQFNCTQKKTEGGGRVSKRCRIIGVFERTITKFYNFLHFWILFSKLFTNWAPLGRVGHRVAISRCLFVCVSVCAIGCGFFRGLTLALRSHDQISGPLIFLSFLFSSRK